MIGFTLHVDQAGVVPQNSTTPATDRVADFKSAEGWGLEGSVTPLDQAALQSAGGLDKTLENLKGKKVEFTIRTDLSTDDQFNNLKFDLGSTDGQKKFLDYLSKEGQNVRKSIATALSCLTGPIASMKNGETFKLAVTVDH